MLELQDTVAVPLLPMLVRLIEPQFKPGGTLSVSDMVPVSPRIKLMVTVETVNEPTLAFDGDVAAIVKSGGLPNVNEAVVECDREPLVAVIVTV